MTSSDTSAIPVFVGDLPVDRPVVSSDAAMDETSLLLCPEQVEQLRFLAELSYPFEACGLLVGRRVGTEGSVLQIYQTRNVSENGARRYAIDPEELLAAEAEAREQGLELIGFWHSHPNHAAEPSASDVAVAWKGYSYLIAGMDALGGVEVRSWRLVGPSMIEEPIRLRRAL